MKNLFFLKIILCLLLIIGCKNKNPNDNSTQKVDHSTAIPDAPSTTSLNLPIQKAEIITLTDIKAMFSQSKDQVYIYSFWKSQNLNCEEVNKTLLEIQKEVGDSTMQLIFINLDDASKVPLVNKFIIENQVTSNVFATSDTLTMDWYDEIHPTWEGDVPAIYLKNESDGTDLFYQKKFTSEELTVLLQPFII